MGPIILNSSEIKDILASGQIPSNFSLSNFVDLKLLADSKNSKVDLDNGPASWIEKEFDKHMDSCLKNSQKLIVLLNY